MRVKLFGAFRQGMGDVVDVEIREGAGLGELRTELARKLLSLNSDFAAERLLADSVFADDERILGSDVYFDQAGSLAVLPPVCGG